MAAVDFTVVFRLATGVVAGAGMLVSYQLFLLVRRRREVAMASFQLQPQAAITDFQRLLAMEVVMLMGLAIYVAGAVLHDFTVFNAGRIGVLLAAIGILHVFYRWVRRFA